MWIDLFLQNSCHPGMGCWFSSGGKNKNGSNNIISNTSAKVISMNGDLRQYQAPVLVSYVLAAEETSSGSTRSDLFICNSDSLYFDQVIPALEVEHQLQPNQIYFVLPSSKREHPLSASDMAALAVKASLALNNNQNHTRRRPKHSRISPLSTFLTHNKHHHRNSSDDHDHAAVIQYEDHDYYVTIGSSSSSSAKKKPLGISRSGSVRKLQRLTSRKAKMAVRSFRLRLTTIYEGTILY